MVRDFPLSLRADSKCLLMIPNIAVIKAQWLSWLERRPVTAEVTSSSLVWVVFRKFSIYVES